MIQLETLSVPLGRVAQKYIDNLPPTPTEIPPGYPELFNYLTKYFQNDPELRKVLYPIANIGSESPLIATQLLMQSLPNIDVDQMKQPTSSNVTFVSRIDVDWKRPETYYALKLFIEVTIATFLEICLRVFNGKDLSSFPHIYDQIRNLILAPTDSALYLSFRQIVAPLWGRCIFYISQKQPNTTYKFTSNMISNAIYEQQTPPYQLLLFVAHSYVRFREVYCDSEPLTKPMAALLKVAGKLPDGDTRRAAIDAFVANFIVQLCLSDVHVRSSSLFLAAYEYFNSVANSSKYTGICHQCRARLLMFSQHKKIKTTPIEYVRKTIAKEIGKLDHTAHCLDELTIIMQGQNYEPYHDDGAEFVGPFALAKDETAAKEIWQIIYKHNMCYNSCQKQLSRCLTQFIALDPTLYYPFVNKMTDAEFTKINSQAVFWAGEKLLHRGFAFEIARPDVTPPLQMVALTYLSSLTTQTTPNVEIYGMQSFVESVLVHLNSVNMALQFSIDEGLPKVLSLSKPRMVSTIFTKWKRLFPTTPKSALFNTEEAKLNVYNIHSISNELVLSALSLVPLAAPDSMTAVDIVPLIYLPWASSSSSAVRCLQVMVHLDSNLINPIIESIVHVMPNYFLKSSEALYVSMQALSMIIESIWFCDAAFDEKYIPFVYEVVFLGLLSPGHVVRSMALHLLQTFNNTNQCNHDVGNLILNDSKDVGMTARNMMLSAISFQDFSPVDIVSMKFSEAAGSGAEFLYQFYIAQIALNLPHDKHVDAALDNIISRFGNLESKYLANALIFFTNYKQDFNIPNLMIFKEKCDQQSSFALLSALSMKCVSQFVVSEAASKFYYPALLYKMRALIDSSEFDMTPKVVFDFLTTVRKAKVAQHELLSFITVYFKRVANDIQTQPNGPFPRATIAKYSQDMEWVTYVLDLCPANEEAMAALPAVLSLFPLADSTYNDFVTRIDALGRPDILAALLGRYFPHQIKNFLEKARTKPEFFDAIGLQFPLHKTPAQLLEWGKNCPEKLAEEEKEYASAVYLNLGSLLAICFYYIIGSCANRRAVATDMISSLVLGTCGIKGHLDSAATILKTIDTMKSLLRTDLKGVCLSQAIILSEALTAEFEFCTEQFVYQIIELCKTEIKLAAVVVPWIHDICFNETTNGVFARSDPPFVSFTSWSFVKTILEMPSTPHTMHVLGKMINGQTKDSMNVLHLVTMAMLSKLQTTEEEQRRYRNYICFIYGMQPQAILSELYSYLTYNSWHFHQIQNNKIEQLLDISKLFESLTGTPQQEEKRTDPIDYLNFLKFVISILTSCARENADPFIPYAPFISLFVFTNTENLNDAAEPLLKIIYPQFSLGKDQFAQSLQKLESKAELATEALAWGLCCDDIEIAIRGLIFYSMLDATPDDESIDKIVESIYIVSRALYEKSHNLEAKSGHALYHLIDLEKVPNWETCRFYISLCFQILAKIVKTHNTEKIELLWIAISALQCNTDDYMAIFNSALALIVRLLGNPSFRTQVKSAKLPSGFQGIFTLAATASFTNMTTTKMMKLLKIIGENQLSEICLPGVDSANFSAIVNALFNDGEIKLALKNDELKVVLMIYAQLGVTQMIGRALEICAEIAKIKEVEIEQSTVVMLVRAASSTDGPRASLALLLSTINSRGTVEIGRFVPQKAKLMPPFPEIKFGVKYNFNDLKIETNPFAAVAKFPPHFLSDLPLFYCPVMQSVNNAVQRISAYPFTEWFNQMFKCQSLAITADTDGDNVEIKPVPQDFYKLLSEKFQTADAPVTEQPTIKSTMIPVKLHAADVAQDDVFVDTIESNVFLPCESDLDVLYAF